jgi:hypothetical protein
MYLIGSACEVLVAKADPGREEDPFSVQAEEVFDRICAQILHGRPSPLALSSKLLRRVDSATRRSTAHQPGPSQ